jgi:hypothetical protein
VNATVIACKHAEPTVLCSLSRCRLEGLVLATGLIRYPLPLRAVEGGSALWFYREHRVPLSGRGTTVRTSRPTQFG